MAVERSIKVRLTQDLTRYHPGLVPGVEGITVGRYGIWSRGSDWFIGVSFPEIGTFDILWEGLEIIDKDYLAEAEERETKKWELLKKARNVVRVVGSRGGFKYLSYEYTDENKITSHVSNTDRRAADKLIEFFRKHGIEIREERLKQWGPNIRFSNDLCYTDAPLIPLRQPPPKRLPPLKAVFVEKGTCEGEGQLPQPADTHAAHRVGLEDVQAAAPQQLAEFVGFAGHLTARNTN